MPAARAVAVERNHDTLRLTFPYDPELVAAVKGLPFATFHSETRSWTAPLSAQAVSELRTWHHRGWTETSIDDLLARGETPAAVAEAVLGTGSRHRPYTVRVGGGGDRLFSRLRSIPGATWDRRLHALTYPPAAGAALADLVAVGTVADPESVLASHDATICYDTRTGRIVCQGNPRAAAVFATHFPNVDVVSEWRSKGLDVGFLDDLGEQMYRGELIRAAGDAAPPEGLGVDLFSYQATSAAIAAVRDGHAVFDEPGLGKTITGIAAGVHRLRAGATRVLVVCPAAVRTQWANEIVRVTGADDVAVVTGSAARRADTVHAAIAAGTRWVVCHYDVLSRDRKLLAGLFAGAYVIADEAHRLKNPDAARTKAMRALSRGAVGRLALTGTPIETNPAEWFDILSGWVHPGILGGPAEFNDRYRWPNQWGGWDGARNTAELRSRSAALYSRHTKRQVAAHLPPLLVSHQVLDPGDGYAAALRRAHADAADEIRAAAAPRNGQALLLDQGEEAAAEAAADMTAVGLLRLMCSSPRLVAQSDAPSAKALCEAGLVPDIDGPKVDYLRTVAAGLRTAQINRLAAAGDGHTPDCDEVRGERMVVFTFSSRMAKLLHARLTEDGVPSLLFTGETSANARDAAVAAFTDPASDAVAFICTDAGAEGLNLGRCCSLLINADLAWTASRMAQRAQRIHRVDGTASRYQVINLTLAGTLEGGIVKMLEGRADLADTLLGEAGSRSQTTGRRRRGEADLLSEALRQVR